MENSRINVFSEIQKDAHNVFCKIHVNSLLLKFCLQSLAGFSNGGGRNPKQDGLLRHGELEVREDVDADVALGESGVGFFEGLRSKIEGIPEHPFHFSPFSVLDKAWTRTESLQEMVLVGQCV